jgi:hypothetical protein
MTWIPPMIAVVAILVMTGLVGVVQIYLELMLDREADGSLIEVTSRPSASKVLPGAKVESRPPVNNPSTMDAAFRGRKRR